MIFSLSEIEFDDAVRIAGRNQSCLFGFVALALVMHTLHEPAEQLRIDSAFYGSDVFLVNAIPRMSEAQAKVTVVGKKDYAFTLEIEPPDGVQMGPFLWQQAENRRTIQVVLAGTKQSSRFVQRDVDLAANLDEAAVNGNSVMGGINLSAKLIRSLAID